MTTIYLVRHGQANFGGENYDQLSPLGFEQARHLGQHLSQRLSPSALFSGTLRRHKETAQAVIESYDGMASEQLKIISEWDEFDFQNLIEVLNPEWTSSKQFHDHMYQQTNPQHFFLDVFSKGIARWVDGRYNADYREPWPMFKARVLSAFDKVLDAMQETEQVVVFTSAGAISCVVQHLLNISDEFMFNTNISLVNCGVTKVNITEFGQYISILNDYSCFDSETHRHLITYK